MAATTDHVIRDLLFKRTACKPLRLDLYLPQRTDALSPVVVWIGGGGWAKMGKGGGGKLAGWLTEHGFAVACIEYRVVGEAPFPAMIQDCKAAVRWLGAMASQYGLDPHRIGAWGDSAGGHLVKLLAVTPHVRDFDDEQVHPEQSAAIRAACSFYGPSDFLSFEPMLDSIVNLLGGRPADVPARARLASPTHYVSAQTPPHLLVHGDADALVPLQQSEIYKAALDRAGVEATLHVLPGVGHDGEATYGSAMVRQWVAAFFTKHLKRGSSSHA